MLRAQGMRQYVLIELLCIQVNRLFQFFLFFLFFKTNNNNTINNNNNLISNQSLWFSIPGIAAGLFAAYVYCIIVFFSLNQINLA